MAKYIELTQNKRAIVDDDDHEYLSQFKWQFTKSRNTGYARRAVATPTGQKYVQMHRVILGAEPDKHVDHINGNGIDNRKENLRSATNAQNCANQAGHANRVSAFKGVVKRKNRWYAQICRDGKSEFVGSYLTQREAAQAYNDAAVEQWGEFAKLNDLSILSPEDDPPFVIPEVSCKYTGVHKNGKWDNWIASCSMNNKKQYLGLFKTPESAAHAYDNFVKENGLNRKLNFPA